MKRGWKPSKTNSKTPDSSLKRLTENTTRLENPATRTLLPSNLEIFRCVAFVVFSPLFPFQYFLSGLLIHFLPGIGLVQPQLL